MDNQLYMALQKLSSVLKERNSPLVFHFNKGLNKKEIDDLLQIFNIELSLPQELHVLFEWHNGIIEYDDNSESYSSDDMNLFSLGIFPPLKYSIESYSYYSLENKFWAPNLFPIFVSGGGDYYLIDCHNSSPDYKKIFFFSPSDPYFRGTISIFDSLLTLINLIVKCYQNEIYLYDNLSKRLKVDGHREFELFKNNNFSSEYWMRLESHRK